MITNTSNNTDKVLSDTTNTSKTKSHKIFITIPDGMEFGRIKIDNEFVDHFIDPKGISKPMKLQEIVKEALKSNKGHRNKIVIKNHFTIYKKSTPIDNLNYLSYAPNRNGKFSTEETPQVVKGYKTQPFRPELTTTYGTFWSAKTYLTEEKRNEVDVKREEQRDSRRKLGDMENTN